MFNTWGHTEVNDEQIYRYLACISNVAPTISIALAHAQIYQVIAPIQHNNEYLGLGILKLSEWVLYYIL